jgi:hypothetical protein
MKAIDVTSSGMKNLPLNSTMAITFRILSPVRPLIQTQLLSGPRVISNIWGALSKNEQNHTKETITATRLFLKLALYLAGQATANHLECE